jgi:signal transduction histidine kinase
MRQSINNFFRAKGLLLGGAALCVLLVLIAVLQFRWINRVSEADHQQRRSLLNNTLRNFEGEFERTLRDTLQVFRSSLGVAPGTDWEKQLNAAVAQWEREAPRPQMLSAVSFASLSANGTAVFKRRGYDATEFSPQPWPTTLTPYRAILEKRLRTFKGDLPLSPHDYIQEFAEAQPLLVFQLVEDPQRQPEQANVSAPLNQPGRSPERRNVTVLLESLAPTSASAQSRPELAGWCFLELNAAYAQHQWLPEQLDRYFSQRGMEGFQLALLTGLPPQALYLSDAALSPADFARADAALPLFARRIQNLQEAARPREAAAPPRPLPPDDAPPAPADGPPFPEQPLPGRPLPEQPLPGQPLPGRPLPGQPPSNPRRDRRPGPSRRPPQEFAAFDAAVDPAAWRLVVRDAHGSLEAGLNQARFRNLAFGFSVFLILGASITLLITATQRMRRLATQQLEFVAGVSHELRTPLSVIQSTSHNLAQGLVKDPQRVQQYGAAIQTEVRRLTNQIEQMLAFAGIQAGRKLYEVRPVNLAEICQRALAEYAATFAAADWQIECQFPDDLPPVQADAQALESAVKNLLHNAQKYAAAGRWLSLRAQTVTARQRREVQLTIADHGPGIAAQDLPHIFEPFYRSRSVSATTIPGAGLGLSLVQRHLQALGGRVTVQTTAGAGTAFTLHLPAAASEPGAEATAESRQANT